MSIRQQLNTTFQSMYIGQYSTKRLSQIWRHSSFEFSEHSCCSTIYPIGLYFKIQVNTIYNYKFLFILLCVAVESKSTNHWQLCRPRKKRLTSGPRALII